MKDEKRPLFILDRDGVGVSARDENDAPVSRETLLAVAAGAETAAGRNIAVPFGAPAALDAVAQRCGCHILRFLDEDDAAGSDAAALIGECVWARDALFLTVRILDLMVAEGKTLAQLTAALPAFALHKRVIGVPGGSDRTAALLESLRRQGRTKKGAGVRLVRPEGQVLLTPSDRGSRLRITAEAADSETAQELCGEVEEMISKF